MPTVTEALRVIAEHYKIEPEQVHYVLTAYTEGRIKFMRRYKYETCGTCQNFDRTPCKASGVCKKRKRKPRYSGMELDTPLPVTQSRLCCTDYLPKEGVVDGHIVEPDTRNET